MKRATTSSCLLFFALLIAQPVFAQTEAGKQERIIVNDSLAKVGETVWSAKGCVSCHTIGKSGIIAPDLAGLFERRTVAWVRSLLRDPDALLERDDTAKALLQRYNNLRMPNLKLSDTEIEA